MITLDKTLFFRAISSALLIVLLNAATAAKEIPKYVISAIPEEFKQNVNAVYWQDQIIFQIQTKSKATYKVFRAITILNENAKGHTSVVVGYDKHSKITSMKGTIYDADGAVLKKLKQNEIYDQSSFDGSLYSDNRLKAMSLSNGNYPYTIEYEYEIEFKNLFQIPGFELLGDQKVSSLSAEYTVIYPKELKPRFDPKNIDSSPEITTLDNNLESVSWKFKNIKPIVLEPFSPSLSELVPTINTAPSSFSFDGYEGNMDSWQNFGQWINSLNSGRNVLPEATKQKVKSIADEFPDPQEKIMAVYEYMQSKTRYVSIQLGIGGFQPFEASVVDQVGYGDCKALSNYMVSLLDVIGVKANYVLVNSGRTPTMMNTNFPSSQFNHAIVCVPMKQDTIWLECTSQTNPFGYMGSHTGNRKALAITNNGAVPVNTPRYTAKENTTTRTADVKVDLSGNAKAKVTTTYSGMDYEIGDDVLGNNFDAQKKWVQENTDIPIFDINSFAVKTKKAKIPSAVVNLDLTLNRFATVSGKRLFLLANLMNRSSFTPPKIEERKNKVVLHNTYTHVDTINYSISEQIYPEHIPYPVKINSRFGSYESRFFLEQGKMVYVRKFVRNNGEFPAESYQELVDFYKSVQKADNTKLVFLNKT